eukprot:CAMPEP_0170457752 /NCGR_PEP_ID=MMETSP0123-20130129/4936_1 /TAXON_ID=182087 /ORGANISM="Favella ehrenbergii, Strain Fehren 1" /LENGTH=74 /DNA_ID=CAMNT_0010721643 /DNA_START=124 /DNA_END=348 /DNA_ORIENTATION=-
MNNFAGPSDTQNFARQSVGYMDGAGDDNADTPFMGNHVVKTVRNLRMSASSNRSRQGEEEQAQSRMNGASSQIQ